MSRPATTLDEVPFFVRAAGEDVFAVLTEPTTTPRGIAAIVLSGGAYVGATNRNRVSVRIARDLASLGFHAVRMDYHGVGDSTGDIDTYPLDRPFVEDLLGVVRFMEGRGIDQFVLVGTTCFGARTALSGAASLPGLKGVVLMAAPIRDFPYGRNPDATSTLQYARRALSRRTLRALRDAQRRRQYAAAIRWKARSAVKRLRPHRGARAQNSVADGMSQSFYAPLTGLARRGTPVLIGYGRDDDFYRDFDAARNAPRLGGLLDESGSRIEVRIVEGSIHALRRISAQDAVVEMIEGWLAALDAELVPAV